MAQANTIVGYLTGSSVKTPAALADTALASFQKAQDDITVAQQAIDAQAATHQQALLDTQAKLDDANAQSARLSRVRQKLADLLA